jgi:hypothetical protein
MGSDPEQGSKGFTMKFNNNELLAELFKSAYRGDLPPDLKQFSLTALSHIASNKILERQRELGKKERKAREDALLQDSPLQD